MGTNDPNQDVTNSHLQDLAEMQERAQRREYERGRREAERDAHMANQDAHLARLDSSYQNLLTTIESNNRHMSDMEKAFEHRMAAMEKAFGEFSAVAQAISEKGISTRTFILGVIAVLTPIVVLFFTSINHT